ncbi:hypothetical protein Lepto7375DRAFT_0613 [Leptolyngbya sp. PCC 7375]|nr:hypothetical protein Lepto7375DRAFT_0613 [Leptolyngbya sp. PCC 7375]
MLEIKIQIPKDAQLRALTLLGSRSSKIAELITIHGAKTTLSTAKGLDIQWTDEGVCDFFEFTESGHTEKQSALLDP